MGEDWSRRRLGVALALTALPVALTSVALRLGPLQGGGGPPPIRSRYSDFAVYAVSNWITLALVVRIVGWRRLRASGLRMSISAARIVAACVAFVVGLGVYGGVSAALHRWGLPAVRGMDFTSPSASELTVLFFSVVMTAAFCEEVFFRVLWVGALRTVMPVGGAALASLVAFAAIHYPYFGPGGVLFISVWALLPLGLFLWFGDCAASVAMHMMNNAFAYLVVPLFLAPPR